jgi:L-rhamnose mutarotase
MQVTDSEGGRDALAQDPVNLGWRRRKWPIILSLCPAFNVGERFAMMEEVFYME